MQTATTIPMVTTPASAEPAARGFPGVCCLQCGEQSLRVYVSDMLIQCGECEWEGTAADVRERMASWSKLLDWLDTAPVVE